MPPSEWIWVQNLMEYCENLIFQNVITITYMDACRQIVHSINCYDYILQNAVVWLYMLQDLFRPESLIEVKIGAEACKVLSCKILPYLANFTWCWKTVARNLQDFCLARSLLQETCEILCFKTTSTRTLQKCAHNCQYLFHGKLVLCVYS